MNNQLNPRSQFLSDFTIQNFKLLYSAFVLGLFMLITIDLWILQRSWHKNIGRSLIFPIAEGHLGQEFLWGIQNRGQQGVVHRPDPACGTFESGLQSPGFGSILQWRTFCTAPQPDDRDLGKGKAFHVLGMPQLGGSDFSMGGFCLYHAALRWWGEVVKAAQSQSQPTLGLNRVIPASLQKPLPTCDPEPSMIFVNICGRETGFLALESGGLRGESDNIFYFQIPFCLVQRKINHFILSQDVCQFASFAPPTKINPKQTKLKYLSDSRHRTKHFISLNIAILLGQ